MVEIRNLSSSMRQTTKYSINIRKISIFDGNHIWQILQKKLRNSKNYNTEQMLKQKYKPNKYRGLYLCDQVRKYRTN